MKSGKYMGKLAYALTLYGENASVCDLAGLSFEEMPVEMFKADIVVNLQAGVRSILERREPARVFFENALWRLTDKILIGDEVGAGIVPMDPFERLWRDETGFVYQTIAARADIVDRVWAGLPARLKG